MLGRRDGSIRALRKRQFRDETRELPISQIRVGDGGDGDGGDGRIFPEHPSPILHAPRDNNGNSVCREPILEQDTTWIYSTCIYVYTGCQSNKKLLNKKHGPSESISYLFFSAPGFWNPFLKTPPETLKARPNSRCPKESTKTWTVAPQRCPLCVHFVLRGPLLAHTSIQIPGHPVLPCVTRVLSFSIPACQGDTLWADMQPTKMYSQAGILLSLSLMFFCCFGLTLTQ